MSLKSAPYWWVVCDGEGCGRSAQDSSDYTAMGDQGSAIDNALEADYAVVGDKHYCDDCCRKNGTWECEGCDEKRLIVHTDDDGKGARWCAKCHAENVPVSEQT